MLIRFYERGPDAATGQDIPMRNDFIA